MDRRAIFSIIFWVFAGCGKDVEPKQTSSAGSLRLVSLEPASGQGSAQNFTLTASHSSGVREIKSVRLLINEDVDGRNACYVFFTPSDRLLALAGDEGIGATNAEIGADKVIENKQCRVNSKTSSATESGSTLKLTVSLAFRSSFAGSRRLFGYLDDNSGATTNFQNMGSWTVVP